MTFKQITINTLQKYKDEGRIITALTAYDYSTAKIIDNAGIDIILVGDSLAMVALGHKTTHSVSVDEMLHHTKAVVKGASRAHIVADMPFMSYQVDENSAVANAGRFIKEAQANAVKIEGGSSRIIETARHCVESGIPVMGHLGFTPQSLHTHGGYNIQGTKIEATKKILDQAKMLEEAGVYAIVLEMVPEESAEFITKNLKIPTIGIGAGRFCSGQILVSDDILGKYSDFTPKFAKKYLDLSSLVSQAITEYKDDVISGKFPSESEIFTLNQEEKSKLKDV